MFIVTTLCQQMRPSDALMAATLTLYRSVRDTVPLYMPLEKEDSLQLVSKRWSHWICCRGGLKTIKEGLVCGIHHLSTTIDVVSTQIVDSSRGGMDCGYGVIWFHSPGSFHVSRGGIS